MLEAIPRALESINKNVRDGCLFLRALSKVFHYFFDISVLSLDKDKISSIRISSFFKFSQELALE